MTETPTDTSAPPPPRPPSGPGDRPLLVRRRRGRMLAGVASGLARHLRVDVTLVRIGFVILAFTGGAGVLGYLAGWVLLPEEDDDGTDPVSWTVPRGASFWVGVGLLVVATIVLVEHTTPFGSSVGTPLVLIAVGVALWKVSQDRADRPPPASVPEGASRPPGGDTDAATPALDAAHAPTERIDAAPGPTWTPPPVPPRRSHAAAAWTPPPATRPRSILGRLTIAVVLLALGGGVLLAQLDLIRFTAIDAAATALFVVGLGLVVGTWFGRARGLVAAGLLLVPVVVVAGFLHGTGIDVGDGAGERFHTVSAVDDLAPEYRLGVGLLQLDLSGVDPPTAGTRTDVRLGAGEIVLLVPEDTHVVVDATVQLGAVELPGVDRGGAGLTERLELGATQASRGTLHVDARLGVGQLAVRIVPTPEDAA